MIGSDELARLIRASLPVPGGNVAHAKSAVANSANLSDNRAVILQKSAYMPTGDMPALPIDWSRDTLKRTLLNQILAESLSTSAGDDRTPRDAGRPYVNAIADDIARIEPNARPASEAPSTLAPEHPVTLNPALSIIAAELTRSQRLTAKDLVSSSDRASALPPAEKVRTKTTTSQKRATNWSLGWLFASATFVVVIAAIAAA